MSEKKKQQVQTLSFTSNRRFGIELEINSFDGKSRPTEGKSPAGINEVALLVNTAIPDVGCEVRGYEHSNADKWVVKPDASCGMEIVSPPSKGWGGHRGLKAALDVANALANDKKIQVDRRCSVHCHVDISDLSEAQLASMVAWYVKCEPVFLDAMPLERKRNRYCQFIGLNTMFQHDTNYSDRDIIARCGDHKYYSMNTSNYISGVRKTVEFRPIEGQGVKDPYLIKNWVRMLIHFVEMTSQMDRPQPYYTSKSDFEKLNVTPWTGLAWLDPEHVFDLMGFNDRPCNIPGHREAKEYALSNGLQQTRNWFLARLQRNMSRQSVGNLRHVAATQLDGMLDRFKASGLEIIPDKHLSPAEQREDCLFGEDYKY